MRKGQLSSKMINRFPIITLFVAGHDRLPTNEEIRKLFKIAKNGVGETTSDILKKYKKSLTHCTLCKHKL